jgi:hypothetical protein
LNELIRQFVDMSLPAFPRAPDGERRFCGEVTRLNGDGQFKPFVYLNGGMERTGVPADSGRPSKAVMAGLDRSSIILQQNSWKRYGPVRAHDRESDRQPSPKRKIPPCGGTFLLSLSSG